MPTDPQASRCTIDLTPEGLRATIPARRSLAEILLMAAWLVGWALGEAEAIASLRAAQDTGDAAFMLLWLAGWTAAGGATVFAILWQLAGREVIRIDATTLEQRMELFGLGRRRAWPLAQVSALRLQAPAPVAPAPPTSQRAWLPPTHRTGRPRLVVEHGGRRIALARGLGEHDARMLASALSARLPRKLLD